VGLLLWAAFQPIPQHALPPIVIAANDAPPASDTTSHDTHSHDDPEVHRDKQDKTTATSQTDHTTVEGKIEIPMPGLFEDVPPFGLLPMIRAKDGMTAFEAYRQPFPNDQLNKPVISVVMMDYGVSAQFSGSILGVMPAQVTLALSANIDTGDDWSAKARQAGHELWLELLTEPDGYPLNDAGLHSLLTNSGVEDNQKNFMAQLGTTTGYVGFFAATDGPYFRSAADLDFAVGNIFDRGLGLVMPAISAYDLVAQNAQRKKSSFYVGNILAIDPDLSARQIDQVFDQAEQAAKTRGYAIIAFRPNALIQKKMLDWLDQLEGQGIALAPLSVIAARGKELKP
jgi:hypothetical protein